MTHPRRITVCLAALLATSILSGCGVKVTQMYSGERLPAEEVALIEPTSSFKPLEGHSIRTYVLAVDGQELAEGAAEVLPGRHTVRAAAILMKPGYQSRFVPEAPFAFDAQAGCTYQIMGHFFVRYGFVQLFDEPEETPPAIWIENKESKEVVAGERPQ